MENGGYSDPGSTPSSSNGEKSRPKLSKTKFITPEIQRKNRHGDKKVSPSDDPAVVIPLKDLDNLNLPLSSPPAAPGVQKKGRFSVSSPVESESNRLDRQKSCSDQNLHQSTQLELPAASKPRQRSGSLHDLPRINKNSPSKLYVPVNHDLWGSDQGGSNGGAGETNYDTVTSFADYIKVSKQRRLTNGAPSTTSGLTSLTSKAQAKRNMRRRLVYKNGESNVTNKHIHKYKRHYLADIFTTLIDLKWRYSLAIFTGSFVLTWVLFAVVWFIIGYAHKDFEPSASHQPCVAGVTDFTTAFLFSLETQHTIGYGTRAMNEECIAAIFMLMIQSITGVLAQALVTGMIFAKISRPKKRAETLMFSKEATISLRDGALCLMFRIGDMRSSHLVESHVRAMVIRRRVTKEGEVLPLDHQDVNLGFDNGTDRLLIIWPVIVIHKIDSQSPFWRMSQADLERENFELIVILEGTIESTGMTTQARTSYLPGEILWGRRLERLVTFQKEDGEYQVDYTRFENTVPVDTPSCSAKDLAAQRPDSEDSCSDNEEFHTLRADYIQTSDTDDESDLLLVPDGGVGVQMFDADDPQ